jgi:orotate phosphoribosyltransferase
MPSFEQDRAELLALLQAKSLFRGEFTLASGDKSNYYIDCKLTTFDARGAWLVGQTMHTLIRREQTARKSRIDSVGGLTMGSDPLALAVAMFSQSANDAPPFRAFSVRKTAKAHGQTKLIEGNFRAGDVVVVLDDVVTRGESTITAIDAVVKEGGTVAFVAVLVDRQEGGRERIEAKGYSVVSLFKRDDLLKGPSQSQPGAKCAVA